MPGVHDVDRTLAARRDDPDWVAFETQAAFEELSPRSPSGRRKVKASLSSSSRKKRSSKPASISTGTANHQSNIGAASRGRDATSGGDERSWMTRPVSADASWIPIPAPGLEGRDELETSRGTSTTGPPASPRRRFTMQEQQPTTPSSVASASRRPKRSDSHPTLATATSSESSSEQQPTMRSPRGVRTPRGRSSARGRSASRTRTPSTQRDPVGRKEQSRAASREPVGRTPSRSRGRPGAASSSPVVAVPSSSSRRHIVSPGPANRTRAQTEPSAPTTPRARSRSRSRSVSRRQRTPSRTPSQTPSNRGRAKPPATTTGRRRGRSASRTRMNRNNRSVSRHSHRSSGTATHNNSNSSNKPPRTLPPRPPGASRGVNGDDGSVRTTDSNIGRDISFGTAQAGGVPTSSGTVRSEPAQQARRAGTSSVASHSNYTNSGSAVRREGSILERLFGDRVSEDRRARAQRHASLCRNNEPSQLPERIHPRILLTATVYHNTATNLWIATINTNQKGVATNPTTASKYLKAFSFPTEREARESAIANAPPKMIPFSQAPNCFICDCKFAVFRRACHCRNCGVCVCSNCSKTWSAKMIPGTYNLKNEKTVRVCTSCDTLSTMFKSALERGDYEETISLYGTGNINLRAPFPAPKGDKKSGEVTHPIHCAVEGGNLTLLRWLVEEHYCPIKKISSSNNKKRKGRDIPITTSKGRTLLSIAMKNLNVDMLRYLVVDKKMSILEVKDLHTSLRALEAVLLTLPPNRSQNTLQSDEIAVPRWDDASYDEEGSDDCSSLGEDPAFLHAADSSTVASKRSDALNDMVSVSSSLSLSCWG